MSQQPYAYNNVQQQPQTYPQPYPQAQYPHEYYQQQQYQAQVAYQQQPQPYYQQQPQYQAEYVQPANVAYQQPNYQPNIYQQASPIRPNQPVTTNRTNAYQQPASVQSMDQERQSNNNNNYSSGGGRANSWGCKSGHGHLDESSRLPFIRKVYCIIMMQIFCTVIMCIIAYTSPPFQRFQVRTWYLLLFAIIIAIGIEIMIFCYPKYAWKVPRNYILMSIFTFCMSWLVSAICSNIFLTRGENGGAMVLMAAVLCFGMTFGLTVYACYTKTDFTTKGAALFMFSISLFFFGFLLIFFHSKALYLLYSFLGVCLYGMWLIYDTQLIMGGKTHEFSVDDYIIAAMMIYIDIIQIFLYLLDLLSNLLN